PVAHRPPPFTSWSAAGFAPSLPTPSGPPIAARCPCRTASALVKIPSPCHRGPTRSRCPEGSGWRLHEDVQRQHGRDNEVGNVHQLTDLEIDGHGADGVGLLP